MSSCSSAEKARRTSARRRKSRWPPRMLGGNVQQVNWASAFTQKSALDRGPRKDWAALARGSDRQAQQPWSKAVHEQAVERSPSSLLAAVGIIMLNVCRMAAL